MLAELAEELIELEGKKMSLKEYNLLVPFYNSTTMKCMLLTGRQIGKSTALAVKQSIRACLLSNLHIMTLFPLAKQSYRFSKLYIDMILNNSDILRERIDYKTRAYTISLKELNNGSNLHYWYAGENADRVRGISVKDIFWDEIQDIVYDVMNVAEQCTSAHGDSVFNYSGTPKTLDNTAQSLWLKTNQSEPYITCSRCSFDNFCIIPGVYKMLKEPGLSCQKCGEVLRIEDVYNAKYKIMNPKQEDFDGFHIPQIFIPRNLEEGMWKKIMINFTEYSEYEFATEVLGISFDTGGRPITREQLYQLCTERKLGDLMANEFTHIVMGVDWGYATQRSYTVMCILGVRPDGKFEVIHAKKFTYRNRIEQREELLKYFQNYTCDCMGVDHGVGLTDNMELRVALGNHKIYEYHYCGAGNKNILNFLKDKELFSTHKPRTLALLFNDMLNGKVLFPRAQDVDPFFNDILSVYESVREGPRGSDKYYDHNPNTPDDFLHALNFAMMTAKLLTTGSLLDTIINK